MIFVALILMATGLLGGVLGYRFFTALLPLIGLVGGSVVGFVGFQSVFGTGAVSTTVAVFVAIVVGAMLALLSFLYFRIAVIAYAAILGASLFTYLGVALGIEAGSFVLALLAVSGLVVGLVMSSHEDFSDRLVIALTSLAGAALILAGVLLVFGNLTIDQLSQEGVIRSVLGVVDQSFLWLFVWLTGGLVLIHLQKALLLHDVLENDLQYKRIKS